MPHAFNHFAFTVSDIERSLAFYADLGFTPADPVVQDLQMPAIKEMTGFPDAHLRIAMISLDGVTLELLQYVSPEGAKRQTLSIRDVGNSHFCLAVDDIEAETARLKAKGVEVFSDVVTFVGGHYDGYRGVYFADPDGNTVELVGLPS